MARKKFLKEYKDPQKGLRKKMLQLSDAQYRRLNNGKELKKDIDPRPPVNAFLKDTLKELSAKRNEWKKKGLDERLGGNKGEKMKEVLGEMSPERFQNLKRGELDTNFFDTPSLNSQFIAELRDSSHLRREYHFEKAKSLDHEAYSFAQEFVKEKLKSPTSAEFPSRTEVKIGIVDVSLYPERSYTYRVVGHVDAKNSFGAKIRNNFSVTLERGEDEWSLHDIRID